MKEIKSWDLLVWTLFAASALSANVSRADATPNGSSRAEVPIGHVFIPHSGYDDNDNIQFVLDGLLPNGCYQVANEEVHTHPSTKEIAVSLFAFHRTDGQCADETHLPVTLASAIPYTLVVSIGQLPKGLYEILYKLPNLVEGITSFSVEKAKSANIDDMVYAAVSSIGIPDIVRGDLPITADIIGSLTTTCSTLSTQVTVLDQGDVFVILQGTNFKTGQICGDIMIPFDKPVNLGTPGAGRYLIQVRSMNGQSVNRVFTATSTGSRSQQ